MSSPYALRLALRNALERKTISVTEVSLSAGLDRSTLSRFLNGRADLKTSSLQKILERFEINLAAVVKEQLNPTSEMKSEPVLVRAFEALTPLQKKTFLKTMSQALRHSTQHYLQGQERERLAEDLDQMRKQMKLQGAR